jgi:hypothetical protein
MNKFLNVCSWLCIAAVSYKYGYERGANEIIMDIADWVISGDAAKAMAHLAEEATEDIPDEKPKSDIALTKTLN